MLNSFLRPNAALVSGEEMAGKIKAALDGRSDPATVIMVRTDAIAVDGLDAAIDRDRRYVDAGGGLAVRGGA